MLSVEPILERALRISGAGAVLGRAALGRAALVAVAVVARGTVGLFSSTEPVVEEGAAGLAAVVRVRGAAVVEVVLRVVVVILGLVESAGGKRALCRVLSCLFAKLDVQLCDRITVGHWKKHKKVSKIIQK